MKLFLFLVLFSFSATADRYTNINDCLSGVGGSTFDLKSRCEKDTNGPCALYTGGNCKILKLEGDYLVVDYVKKQSFESTELSSKELEDSILRKESEARKGSRIVAIFRAMNEKKGLTKSQRVQLLTNSQISSIMNALNTGNLDIAKDLITSYVPDGVLVTTEDKTFLLKQLE